jgi:signal transduction histidine kinase
MTGEQRSRPSLSRDRDGENRLDLETTGYLLSLMAHDLRNPLSALGSSIGYLVSIDQGLQPDSTESLADAQVSCVWLLQLTDNLDMLARHLMGKSQLPKSRLGIASVVMETVALCLPIAESYHVPLVLDPELSRNHETVRSNRELLSLATANLVLNAVQHGVGGDVEIGLSVAEGNCSVTISDSGPVLTADQAEFEFRARGQTPSKSGSRYSRGLGLFVAHVAAEAAGAHVRMVASPTSRSCLELRVPID